MKTCVLIFGVLLTVSGCVHKHKIDGPVQESFVPAGVQVRIGSSEVKEGDTVVIQKEHCKTVHRKGTTEERCRKEVLGEATVIKVLDHDSAIIEPPFKISSDDSTITVEKK